MSEVMYNPGRFVWHEIYTSDIEKTKAFYGELLNWKFETVPMQGMPGGYVIASLDGKQLCGLVSLSMVPGAAQSFWIGYVSVPDVDASAAAAKAAGGMVPMGPTDIPGIGRFATIIDPQGGASNAYKSTSGDGEEPATPAPGSFCWDTLNANDTVAATDFYNKVFGWSGMTMPGMGDTTIFMHGDKQRGSMNKNPMPGTPASWLSYMFVENLEASVTKATRMGAKIMMENVPVPEFGRFTVMQDNVGCNFALFTGK